MNINPQKIVERGIVEMSEYSQIQQVGIDLSIDSSIIVPNLAFSTFVINEKIHMPPDMFALVFSRSTWNRQGIIIRGVVLDPGYEGRPSFTIYNLSGDFKKFEKGTRMLQIVFFRANAASKYDGQYMRENLGDDVK